MELVSRSRDTAEIGDLKEKPAAAAKQQDRQNEGFEIQNEISNKNQIGLVELCYQREPIGI